MPTCSGSTLSQNGLNGGVAGTSGGTAAPFGSRSGAYGFAGVDSRKLIIELRPFW
jgi:hypothetical protein